MSDAVSALGGVSFDGIARIEECGLQGMITLRGDLSDQALAAAVTRATGQKKLPEANRARVAGESGVCWMSPDELLLLVPYEEVGGRLEALVAALKDSHALAVNVSDARAVFRVTGDAAREVLAKLAPVDLSRDAFQPGRFRRTRLAQVPAAFWMEEDESFRIVCFRSVADYVFKLLKVAAQPGSKVGVL
ncbi:sarcosine oxidase subunit gamma [Cribrihabitans marinus]|uniref:Sarcosine oxidase subunit gamma n=1 Tax=Cribrihabitans marinus TaxID=1227549 RepID=A0A1H6V7J0_9RHOB|nr:sarcosine oxidase subunit gamma family protein [Cribrihabitans marinus]GGH26579.1 sarcosine oxidase subunit gamma [Cribrihabitans marinus]SEI97737.1 sarcosine oxidase subunit gamma [Cribrihabitans marinus]